MTDSLSWFPFSIAATILLGISLAFYKTPSAKGQNRAAATFWSMVVPFILSAFFFYGYLPETTWPMVFAGMIWGVTFAILVSLQMYALSHVETNVLFPINTTSSLLCTVLLGLLIFGGSLSFLQILGIVLIVIVVFLFLYKGGRLQYSPLVIKFLLSMLAFGVFNKLVQKFVADSFDIHAYQIYQYLFAMIAAFILLVAGNWKEWRAHIVSSSLKTGAIIGVFSFFGGYSLLLALTKGPFALITSIHSLYIIVVALLGRAFFREELSPRKIALIVLAIAAIILIRIG
jgi:drug/metabolite transporter (DMT)-like permease